MTGSAGMPSRANVRFPLKADIRLLQCPNAQPISPMSVAYRRDSDEEHFEPRFELPIPPGPTW